MNNDDLRYLHAVANNCAFLAEQILSYEGDVDYIIRNDFLPLFRWIQEKAKEAGV